MRCHIAAFAAMDGVPEEILYDRMKTAVIGEDEAGVRAGGDVPSDLGEVLAHHTCVGVGHDERGAGRAGRADGSEM